jgi:hypothetical protein
MAGHPTSRTRHAAAFAVATGLLAGVCAAGCRNGGDFTLFGYTTAPPFDPSVRSVYIPVFKNTTFHTSPHRGIEADITQAIVTELNRRRSPIRVVSDCDRADTELVGSVTQVLKIPQNRNLQNLVREFDLFVTVEVVWRDLRSGRVLTGTRQPATEGPPPDAFDPSLPPPAPPQPVLVPAPVQVTAVGRAIPELGESNTTAQQAAVNRLAKQIVNMMEQPW